MKRNMIRILILIISVQIPYFPRVYFAYTIFGLQYGNFVSTDVEPGAQERGNIYGNKELCKKGISFPS